MTLLEQIIILVVHIILATSFIAYPFFTKRNISFGIKIPMNALTDKKIINIKYKFMILVGITGVIMAVLGFVYTSIYGSIILIFVAVSIYTGIYLYAHFQTKKFKKISNWHVNEYAEIVIDTSFRSKPLVISNKWYILYLGIVIITIAVIQMKFETLPDMLFMQTNSLGEKVNLVPKGRALVYLVAIQSAVMALMVFVQYIIKHAKQDLSGSNMKESVEENIRFRHKFSKILYILGFVVGLDLMFSIFFTMGIIQSTTLFLVLVLGSLLILIVYLLVSSFKYGQDGSRLNKLTEESSDDFIDKEDDQYWLLGMIYFNKNDPAIFISKRVGIGWSVNHARWQAWMFYAVIIVFVIVVTVMS